MAKILIVDDSETLRSQLKKDLEGHGHTVIEAADGSLGLEALFKDSSIELILCDVNMPVMDGLTMCKKAAENEAFKNIPKLMLTTESNATMKAQGKEAGVIAWITKPYNATNLLGGVDKVLSRKRS